MTPISDIFSIDINAKLDRYMDDLGLNNLVHLIIICVVKSCYSSSVVGLWWISSWRKGIAECLSITSNLQISSGLFWYMFCILVSDYKFLWIWMHYYVNIPQTKQSGHWLGSVILNSLDKLFSYVVGSQYLVILSQYSRYERRISKWASHKTWSSNKCKLVMGLL